MGAGRRNWNNTATNLQSSNRNNNTPTKSNNNIGFRVARPLGAVSPEAAPRRFLPARIAASIGRPRPCRVQGPPGRSVCPPLGGETKNRSLATVSRQAKAVAGYRYTHHAILPGKTYCTSIVGSFRRTVLFTRYGMAVKAVLLSMVCLVFPTIARRRTAFILSDPAS
jgi:hypothetical protein